jgi:predicted O-methyltransferase YrrM
MNTARQDDVRTLQEYVRHCSWPNLYYGVISELCTSVNASRFLEIGVAYGYHALDILAALPHIQYYGVDPYLAGYDVNDHFAHDVQKLFHESSPQAGMDRLYGAVAATLAPFSDRARLLRKRSGDAAGDFPPHFFDTIFVDGDHTYAGVKTDLHAWWDALRPGGIYCGDDFLLPAVQQAVQEFAVEIDHQLFLANKKGVEYPIWFIKKTMPNT